MRESIRQTIQKFRLIPSGVKLVVAVSGGADSLALLHILYTLQPYLSCTLHVATLDHGLRGDAGADDARFVVELAESWGFSSTVGRVDVGEVAAQNGLGIESAARHARYNFLAQVSYQIGANRVAVAHHADDQAETVLMHLLRGSGMTGLRGMALQSPMPTHPDLILIRPLLWVTRREIESYCREHALSPREDVTNRDTSLLRNYIRWETLPHLQQLNPNIVDVLGQVAEIAQLEDDFVYLYLQEWLTSGNVTVEPQRIMLDRDAFRKLHPALARRVVIWSVHHLSTDIDSLGYQHILGAVELGTHGIQGKIAMLTKGVRLRVDYNSIIVEQSGAPLPLAPGDQPLLNNEIEISVKVPGETQLPETDWSLVVSLEEPGRYSDNTVARIAVSNNGSVSLRGRQHGDRFAPLGMAEHTQKLNRWMINHKIPVHLRAGIPLLCVGDDIAAIYWGGNWFVAMKYTVSEKNARLAYFHFKKNS